MLTWDFYAEDTLTHFGHIFRRVMVIVTGALARLYHWIRITLSQVVHWLGDFNWAELKQYVSHLCACWGFVVCWSRNRVIDSRNPKGSTRLSWWVRSFPWSSIQLSRGGCCGGHPIPFIHILSHLPCASEQTGTTTTAYLLWTAPWVSK